MPAAAAPRHLLSICDLSQAEITALLEQARQLKARRRELPREAPLRGKTLAMIFQKPSLRTRVSFETGMTLLGGHAIYLAPSDISLGQRERIDDIALVLSGYADAIMARVFGHEIVQQLAQHAHVPVINGLSDLEHPCQILADLLTVQERKGKLTGLRGAYIGDGNNVCHSLMLGAATCGMHFAAATPNGYEPAAAIVAQTRRIAESTGVELQLVNDPRQAVRDADFVYTDVWTSMGQEAETALRREKFAGYQINAELMRHAKPDALILHCLPAHYGEEIDYAASRSPNSVIFEQAENRMHAQNALLLMLLAQR